jgi:hypothetical protein
LARRSSGEGGLRDVKRAAQARIYFSIAHGVANPPFARSEIFEKSEKKACQLSGSSINEGKLRTNRLIFRSKIFSKK